MPSKCVCYKYNKDGCGVHKAFHSLNNNFIGNNGKFLYKGYELIKKIEKWSRKFPQDVQIVGCDDAFYTGSDLVLIEHKTKKEYHGTSILYIPQCTGEEPIYFFLYPGHRKNLIAALKKLGK